MPTLKKTKEKKILSALKKKNINWIQTGKNDKAIDVYIKFGEKEGYPTISFETSYKGDVIVNKQVFTYENPNEAANDLALYIFNVGNEEKSFNMNDTKGNLYSLSGSQASNNTFKNVFSSSVITSSAFTKSMAN